MSQLDEQTPLLSSLNIGFPSIQNTNIKIKKIESEVEQKYLESKDKAENQRLCEACMNGNDSEVKDVISSFKVGGDVTSIRSIIDILLIMDPQEELNPIQLAVFYDHPNVLEYLLQELNVVFKNSKSSSFSRYSNCGEVIDVKAGRSKQFATALMLSSSIRVAQLLIDHGASIEARNSIGMTALHYAASSGNAGIVSLLLEKGAEVNQIDNRGATPLHWAVYEGYQYTAMLLVGHEADQFIQDSQLQTPLMLASALGDSFLAKQLVLEGAPLKMTDRYGRTAMDLAKKGNHFETIQALRTGKSDRFVSYLSRKGFTIAFFWIFFFFAEFVTLVFTVPSTSNPSVFFSISFFLFISIIISYLQVWLRDPGYVEPTCDPPYQLLTSDNLGVPCPTCKTAKPLRSKHCHSCRRCVYRFDHHCPWINNCVGIRNHAWFVFFICAFAANCIIISTFSSLLIFNVLPIIPNTDSPINLFGLWRFCDTLTIAKSAMSICGSTYCYRAFHLSIIILGSIFGLPTVVLVFIQIRNISRNLTTNETYNKEKYPYLKTPSNEFHNPYDIGFCKNWKEICLQKDINTEFVRKTVW